MKNSWSVSPVTFHLSEAMQHSFVLKSFTDCRIQPTYNWNFKKIRICPSKKIRIKGNTKPCFDSEIISIVTKCDGCYKKLNSSGLKTDKYILRATKQFLKTAIQKKKRMFFQDKWQEDSKNSKELWKTLKSLGLNSEKAGQSKICLKEDDVT